MNRRPACQFRARGGFTLIEIMVVVGILAMVLALGMPPFLRSLNKDPLRKAVSEIEKACSKARELAILHGVAAELMISAAGQLSVSEMADQRISGGTQPDAGSESAVSAGTFFSAQWPADVVKVRLIYANLKAQDDTTETRVHFYPNGTSDEFTMVLETDRGACKISLECVTGLATLEVIR
jgi:prepilin-type N-terminal cleavage/methylation domain-containing protein